MTIQEAIDQISLILGARKDLQVLAKRELSHAQDFFQQGPTMPWFLLSEVSHTTTIDETRRIVVPEDFLMEYEEGALWREDEAGEIWPLEKLDLDQATRKYGRLAQSVPCSYSLDGRYFRLFPKPDGEYKIEMLYYKKDASISTLADSASCLWLLNAPNCLIGRAGGILAAGLSNPGAAEKFAKLEAEGRVLLTSKNEQMKHVNRSYQIGGPH